MHVYINWRIWGLPLGWSRGVDRDWAWAFSLGPVHFVVHKEERD